VKNTKSSTTLQLLIFAPLPQKLSLPTELRVSFPASQGAEENSRILTQT
jgi:hypothetical protein